jgi:hypothetical protein
MISLIGPYVLTLMGVIFKTVHDFTGMAVLLTVIGVVWTGIGGLVKDYSKKALLISEAVHALIWIGLVYFPGLVGNLLGGVIGLLVAFVVAVLAYIYIIEPIFSSGKKEKPGEAVQEAAEVIPGVIFDQNNNRWQCQGVYGDHAVYYDDSGRQTIIYHGMISGTQAINNDGVFHWN